MIQSSTENREASRLDTEGEALRRRALQAELREARKSLQQEQAQRIKLEATLAKLTNPQDPDHEVTAFV